MTAFDAAVRTADEQVRADLQAQDDAWGCSGWTRRRFLAGAGMVGVAALGSQLVTTRAAYASTPSTSDQTLVVVFLRGAADGLRILVPNSSDLGLDHLRLVRPKLIPTADNLLALSGVSGWALNKKLQPIHDALWSTGELAFVPGCSSSGITRSHFQAQKYLENGGSDTSSAGWLARVLERLGPGTTFRAVTEGMEQPISMSGSSSLTLSSVGDFVMPGWDDIVPASQAAVLSLYRGVGGTLGPDVSTTMSALTTAAKIRALPATKTKYPNGNFAASLKDLASILRAEVGLQVATVDVGGWDTHTDEANDLDNNLAATAAALRAFMDDLGPTRRQRVTVAVMTEFGRRVAMNASGGTDHGHGSLMWLLGGGLSRSDVFGKWTALSDTTLADGDVPGVNDPFAVLGELVQKRLGIGTLGGLFQNVPTATLGVAKPA